MRYKKYMLYLLIVLSLIPINTLEVVADNTEQIELNKETVIEGYDEVARSSKLIFYFNKKDSSLIVKDRVNGYMWTSSAINNSIDISKLNDKIKGDISSLFSLNYTNIKAAGGGSAISYNLKSPAIEASFEDIKNGIRGNYYLQDIGIRLTAEMTLEDSTLNINIPADSIHEEGDMKLVSIEIMPYFGASNNEENGYLFYPDGCGAIMEFNDLNHHDESKKTWNIYGTDISELFSLNKNKVNSVYSGLDNNYESLMMPVFGVKKGDNAFLSIVEEGNASSNINLRPSSDIMQLNSISCEFIYRNSFNDPRVKSRDIKQFDKNIIYMDHSIKYVFLEGENADYSGMANTYRTYLMKTGKITKHINQGDKIPLAVDLFMGINEKDMFFDKYIPMTTFKEAQTIMEDLLDAGVEQMQTQLKGWTKKGYYTEPISFPPNRKLGGEKGLNNLNNFAKAHNIELYLAINPIFASASNGGFSKRNDVVYLGNQAILTDATEELFCLNPSTIYEKFFKNILDGAKRNSVSGISLEDVGRYVYYDYNKRSPMTKEETKDVWNKMLSEASLEFENVMVSGGNAYTLDSVDRLAEIPMDDSGYYFTTKSVPFYQMVIHGLLPYSSNRAGNLSPNLKKEILIWIEKGYMPYFELTYRSADLLKYTDYSDLFTSTYEDWVQQMVDIYKELNQEVGNVWSEHITKHEEIQSNVIRVTYGTGTQIIINYNEDDVKIDDYTIRGLDFLVTKGGI